MICCRKLWAAGTILFFMTAGHCWAAGAIVTDGDTVIVKDITYRLDGIDAPQTDQVCLDEKGTVWACGIEARDQLKAFIGKRDVQCDGKRSDPVYRNRQIATCVIEGEAVSLNQWLVREGWALNFGPAARQRFKADQDEARDKRRGLWKGCFASPRALRDWEKSGAVLLGSTCPSDNDRGFRDLLVPIHPTMPEGCSIKGTLAMRAHLTGHRGIYHTEGCKSYQRIKTPNRWFCSEQEAMAEGYRAPFTCRTHGSRQ